MDDDLKTVFTAYSRLVSMSTTWKTSPYAPDPIWDVILKLFSKQSDSICTQTRVFLFAVCLQRALFTPERFKPRVQVAKLLNIFCRIYKNMNLRNVLPAMTRGKQKQKKRKENAIFIS
ncbi:hypothetical protein VIN7_10423 [Saccharomyces cerevisiae x Saccharomyces kudriavzevii VIN7]|uniref:Uncharacterized protein n=1 Tax=Saccharomyces cerevisiae x Saccharomyces kudriavzevii (strain VIN7) TaxID=1095631 RepID=H0H277_SACCK|nr:hypothetical protein VIN7_10423 [Saccharomyces cerevisiae x Saccharomyces kudriavzevii VIN7]